MTHQEAIQYSKAFLGEGFEKLPNGLYRSADGMRTMRFDLTHHTFRGKFYSGNYSPVHINLNIWRVPVIPGTRNKLLKEIIIWII